MLPIAKVGYLCNLSPKDEGFIEDESVYIVSQPSAFFFSSNSPCHLVPGRLLLVLITLLSAVDPAFARSLPVRLEVEQSGIHEISYGALGLSDPLPSSRLQLSRQGQTVAIQLDDGGDGVFEAGDSIRFYGRAVSRSDRLYKYTGTAVYRLEQLPAGQQGLRMSSWQDAACPCQSPASFRDTLHTEENRIYWQQLPSGSMVDHWFWSGELRVRHQKTFAVTLPNRVGGPADIRVHLHGSTSDVHLTRMLFNGNPVGDFSWPATGVDGAVPYTITAQLPTGLFMSRQNTVAIVARDSGAAQDGIYVDWIEIDYDRAYSATDGELKFSVSGTGPKQVSLQGFSSPSTVRIFDLSDPDQPRAVKMGDTEFQTDPGSAPGPYIAVDAGAIRHPLVGDFSTDTLRSVTNGADYIIITDPSLVSSAEPLRLHRAAQGLRSRIVTMQSIYDEFADGFVDPDAIKTFLTYAYEHWQSPQPQYVLLLGDANFDYRDYFGNDDANLVPVHLIETPGFGEVPSDNWFVTIGDNDPYPDMWIGRIPARTPAEVTMVVDKILQYEAGMSGDWPARVIAASGDNKP